MSSHRVRFILAATFLAALAGCGQKGPLYLPVDETQPLPADGTAPAADPAAAPDAATGETGTTDGAAEDATQDTTQGVTN